LIKKGEKLSKQKVKTIDELLILLKRKVGDNFEVSLMEADGGYLAKVSIFASEEMLTIEQDYEILDRHPTDALREALFVATKA
tara:strand:- start:207 stop:455 length:249 start_codon:yes stop_codon:yes gene_type:complete